MSRRGEILLLFGTLALAVGVAAGVGSDSALEANDSATVSIDDSIETPAETVTVESEAFTVTGVARVFPGETLTVNVTGTDAEHYQINLYTVGQEVVDFHLGSGDETVAFETTHLDPVPGPGSYVVAAVDNQDFLAVHPVVLAAYRVDVDAPTAVETGTAFDVSVTLDAVTGGTTPGDVELVVWNEERRERIPAPAVGDETYEATVGSLANGTYEVYAVVIDEETVDGQENVVGLSDPVTVRVTDDVEGEQTTPEDVHENGNENGERNGDGDGAGTENDGVLTPSPTDDVADGSADDDGVGFGIVIAVVAFLGLVAVHRRWNGE